MNKNYWRAIALMIILVTILVACTQEEEEFIQGKWGIGNAHYWSEWDFDNGFYYYSISYAAQISSYQEGRYRVLEQGDGYILLELYDQEGSLDTLNEPVDMRIEFDVEEDMITVNGREFYRVDSSSLEALSTSRAP